MRVDLVPVKPGHTLSHNDSSPRTSMARAAKRSETDGAAQVRAYIAGQPPRTRVTLKKMRETIFATAPENAVEAFSYRIPAVKLDGKALVWYAGFTNHTSIFPISDAIKRKLAADLERFETSKGGVRFPLDKPLPVTLVKKLVKARVEELRNAARTSKTK